ncbi:MULTISPECIES: hypothetical protein [Ruegeria]|uniref:Cardiolipin synthase N-terminal domain-containing protein n=1 Tax=Ruegeria denitrificans TaxID=1715692 RepID=A0A0P1IJL6_9RHOB|nr:MULTISPECIES: hypothetical protein [Ruegeria]MBY6083786.1 hypothetical protein [Ruegeria arenilitoris]NOC45874.1 hypothetical protein [Ruegeria sp. HKCCD7559]NOD86691.1 hypothetical protein [Ruegeria sp. HKCCD6119]CUK16679.1 hypothetical protein RUE5091_04022 [Ruegeria denitrificans]
MDAPVIQLIFMLILLVVVIWLYILPITMAGRRNRSGLIWFLIGLVGSPLLAILLLLALGDAPEQPTT